MQIRPDDGLPQVACVDCLSKLEYALSFINDSFNVQKKFGGVVIGDAVHFPGNKGSDEKENDKITECNEINHRPETSLNLSREKENNSENAEENKESTIKLPREKENNSENAAENKESSIKLSREKENNSENAEENKESSIKLPREKKNSFESVEQNKETSINLPRAKKSNFKSVEENNNAVVPEKENNSENTEEISNDAKKNIPSRAILNRNLKNGATNKKKERKIKKKEKIKKKVNEERLNQGNLNEKAKKHFKKICLSKYMAKSKNNRIEEKIENVENVNPNNIKIVSTIRDNEEINNEKVLLEGTVENVNPNNIEIVSTVNDNEEVGNAKVLFEGTLINNNDDTSIIVPLKSESTGEELSLDESEMAEGSEIIQARDIMVWIPSQSELSDTTMSETTNEIHTINTRLSRANVVQLLTADVIEQSSEQEVVLKTSEQLIILDVPTELKPFIKSDSKPMKISELMSNEEKEEIEKNYVLKMSEVNDEEVNENIVTIGRNQFKCKLCDLKYGRIDKCQVHIWRHLNMKPFCCTLCDFATLTKSNIRCHIRKKHLRIKPFTCHVCQKSYNSSTLLNEHMNSHLGIRPYTCKICKTSFGTKQVLTHHMANHKKNKDVFCDICNKAFNSNSRMRSHRKTHTKNESLKCDLCSAYYSSEEGLQRHKDVSHKTNYVCETCGNEYTSPKALRNHKMVHSEPKFQCDYCSSKYKSKHILKEHILKDHEKRRIHECKICKRRFGQQSHLASHMNMHGPPNFQCPGCDKKFNRNDNMKTHTKKCQKFLANPALQGFYKKRKINFSKNATAKVRG